MVFDVTKWLRWFSIFDIAAVEESSKFVYYHLPTSIEFPIAEYDKATKKSQLFCCLEYALRHEIKKRDWVVTLEIYPEFTGATIIAGISSQPREIAFKRNKEKNHTVKALCMAFFEAMDPK